MEHYTVIVKNNYTDESFEVRLHSMSFSKDKDKNYVEVKLDGLMLNKSYENEENAKYECNHIWKDYLGLEDSWIYCSSCGTKKNED